MFVCWSVPSSRDWPGSTSRSPGNGKARSRDSRPGAPASLQAGAARFPTGGFARTHVSAALQDVPSQPPPHLCGYVDFLRGQGRGGKGLRLFLSLLLMCRSESWLPTRVTGLLTSLPPRRFTLQWTCLCGRPTSLHGR